MVKSQNSNSAKLGDHGGLHIFKQNYIFSLMPDLLFEDKSFILWATCTVSEHHNATHLATPENRELAYEWRAVHTGHLSVSISCIELITGDSAHFRTETRRNFASLTHSMYRTAILNGINTWFLLRSPCHSSYEWQARQELFASSCTSVCISRCTQF
jgi:hypothetical protein